MLRKAQTSTTLSKQAKAGVAVCAVLIMASIMFWSSKERQRQDLPTTGGKN
jgi:hypothetical protein